MTEKQTGASRDEFDTEADLYRAMGMMLGVIDGLKGSKPVEGVTAQEVWEGVMSLLDDAARIQFGDAWQTFKARIRETYGEVES